MVAKEKHKIRLLQYLSDWDNPFPNKNEMAAVLGVQLQTMYYHFTPAELNEILNEGLELRKKDSAGPRSEVYEAMLKEAKGGVVPAQKEFLERTEGKVVDKLRVGFDGPALNAILDSLPPEQAELTRIALLALNPKKSKS